MSDELWSAVDHYINDLFIHPDPALEAALQSSAKAGLPAIQVSPAQGKFLHLLACAVGAKKILEIGTLGGYSAIWLARALPTGGQLITLEVEPKHAAVAGENLRHAGLNDRVEIRLGPALKTLHGMISAGEGPFDLIFIDADKPAMTEYFEAALQLSRPGTLMVVDNVVRKGAVIHPDTSDPAVNGVRRFHERAAAEPRVRATTLQTVGSKGYDGFTLLVVDPL